MLHARSFSRRAVLLLILLLFALTSCGDDSEVARRPTSLRATAHLVVTPPSEDVSGEQLPGKLLFVRAGVVWLWQEGQGRPLFGDGATIQPTWSRDGSRIAYVQRGDSSSDLFVADSEGALVGQLTQNSGDANVTSFERIYQTTWAFYPAWSPDGSTVAYAGQASPPTGSPAGEYNLSLFETAFGDSSTQLLADNEAHCGRMIYGPDGASFIYVREPNTANGQQQIYRYAPGAAVGEPLPGAPEGSYDPALSPDGAWLAFASRSGNQSDIWALPASGAGQQPLRLTAIGSARAPAFSPNGTLLAFLAVPPGGGGFELWVVDIERDAQGNLSVGQPRQITQDLRLDADSGLSWGP